jgi:hypothetical protein
MLKNNDIRGIAVFKYLWMVTQDLFLAVTLTTLMHVMLLRLLGQKGRMIHGSVWARVSWLPLPWPP